MKEADEHVRFVVAQAFPPPVYRTACHGHVLLYVTANIPVNRRGGKKIHNNTLSGGPCISFNTVLFSYLFVLRIMYCATLIEVILLLINEMMMMVKIAIHNIE